MNSITILFPRFFPSTLPEALQVFKTVYPKITAGSEFNPLAVSEVLPLYKSSSEKLVEEYGYSGINIVFDEFSKFIESQDGFAAGANMRLIQDICELATDSGNSHIFFTMVAHKSIKEYWLQRRPPLYRLNHAPRMKMHLIMIYRVR